MAHITGTGKSSNALVPDVPHGTEDGMGKMAKDNEGDESDAEKVPECAVCLQTCIHPVRLPCSHIFCFLCVKGVANQSKRCALCRQEIPVDFLNNPALLRRQDLLKDEGFDGYQWFYEGRNGWWQYDERTSIELEDRLKNEIKAFEILIAGFLYVIDLDQMVQMRRNDPTRRRRIKRDLDSIEKKGVAGLKTYVDVQSPTPLRGDTTPADSPVDMSVRVDAEGDERSVRNGTGNMRTVVNSSQPVQPTGSPSLGVNDLNNSSAGDVLFPSSASGIHSPSHRHPSPSNASPRNSLSPRNNLSPRHSLSPNPLLNSPLTPEINANTSDSVSEINTQMEDLQLSPEEGGLRQRRGREGLRSRNRNIQYDERSSPHTNQLSSSSDSDFDWY